MCPIKLDHTAMKWEFYFQPWNWIGYNREMQKNVGQLGRFSKIKFENISN